VHGCTKRTIGSEISLAARFALNVPQAQKYFLSAVDGPPGDVGQTEARFGPFGDNVNLHGR
jgi:hypothetical protein